ncbi:response regulator [Salinarimonas soli]|uniref:Response regulator n=1 Tax=Salinarimonas soli TaxID=1638099 RepID=A0A5B2V844_9HYPH|nr:response regulator [Salinarimonas soli]KAA2234745.1 response regulator [Salinarimonas soli]
MNILVVEDEPLVRLTIVDALLDAGFTVIEATTAEEALKHCDHVDALFTDIRLPGDLTGWDIAERCREAHPNIPVIYATGFSHVPHRNVPGSVFFPKPYRADHVIQAIRELTTGV